MPLALVVDAPRPAPGPVPAPALRLADDGLLADFLCPFQESTQRTYRKALAAFAAWMGCPLAQLPATLIATGRGPTTRLVRRYKGERLAAGVAPASVNVALSAIRSLVRTLRTMDCLDWAVDVQDTRVIAYRDTAGPGLAVIRRLVAVAGENPRPDRAARDQAAVLLAFALALRSNELTSLELEHVELSATGTPTGILILGKGARDRVRLTLPPATAEALARWIALRGPAPGRLFGFGNRGFAAMLGRLTARSGAPHVRPHGIRHTSISCALDATFGDIRRTQAFSRHAKPATVLRYDDSRRDFFGEVAGTVSLLV